MSRSMRLRLQDFEIPPELTNLGLNLRDDREYPCKFLSCNPQTLDTVSCLLAQIFQLSFGCKSFVGHFQVLNSSRQLLKLCLSR